MRVHEYKEKAREKEKKNSSFFQQLVSHIFSHRPNRIGKKATRRDSIEMALVGPLSRSHYVRIIFNAYVELSRSGSS